MNGSAPVARHDSSRNEWVWKFPAETLPLGVPLTVEMNDSAVFVHNGRVIGVLQAGRYVLDPGVLPFLQMVMPEGGQMRVEIYFLETLHLFKMHEPRPINTPNGSTWTVNVDVEATLTVRDPAYVVSMMVNSGNPSGLEPHIRGRIAQGVVAAIENGLQQSSVPIGSIAQSILPTFGPAILSPIVAELGNGFTFEQIAFVQLPIDEGDPGAGGAAPAPPQPEGEEDVYEMLWDCKYCGQRKNLGLSHRFCPTCGGPQDAGARYFPEDHEKIAVRNHPFVGADVSCPSCKHWNSNNAKCCTNCGGPLTGGASAQLRPDQVSGQANAGAPPLAQGAPPAPASGKKWSGILIALLVVAVLGGIGVACTKLFAKRDGSFEVADRAWLRTIQVERYDLVRQSAWCDERPPGGVERSRAKAQRSTNKVADGQTCVTKKKDRGNGTFKQERECTPKYKEVPVYADKCEYDVPAWKNYRTLKAEGGEASTPDWPKVDITRTGMCMGCEREGSREEKYTVKFLDAKTKELSTCDTGMEKWKAFSKGSKWDGQVGVYTNVVDCDSLKKK